MSGSRLHSINESRARLGNIGRDAVYDLLNSGQLAKKIGRRTFVTDELLENYIQNLPPFRNARQRQKPRRPRGRGPVVEPENANS